MKHKYHPLLLTALALLLFTFFTETALGYADYSPTGRTGAPPNGSSCTSCHSNPDDGSLNLDFSGGTEYTPGETYSMDIIVMDPGKKRFGFSMVARDEDNNAVNVGAWISETSDTIVQGSHVGHFNAPFEDDTHTFTVKWTAPPAGVGDVKFYVAANAANGNHHQSGDAIYLSTLTISEFVAPTPPPTFSKPVILANGDAQMTLTGVAGEDYTVEYSTNLLGWISLETATVLQSGSVVVTDTSASDDAKRFYRATQVDP